MREREERTVDYTVFLGNSNRLGDEVKTDERNGYGMREKEERTVGKGLEASATPFFWEPLLRLGDGVKTTERNGYQMRKREERTVG